MTRETFQILGYGIDNLNLEQAVDRAFEVPGQIVTINPEMINEGNKNQKFSSIIKNSSLIVPDGIGVVLGLKILGHNIKRVPGIELGKALLYRAAKEKKTVALIGAKEYVINLAVKNLISEIPNLNIAYVQNGYFTDEQRVQDEIIKISPDLILVALGSPKQELFISDLKSKLPNAIMIGLGGSFDVWAGVVKRAPQIYQNLGLEWLYRVIKDKSRIKRIFPTIPIFLLEVLKERLRQR